MAKVKLLVTIRDFIENDNTVCDICNDFGLSIHYTFLGHGTAKKQLLNYLGIGEKQKSITLSLFNDNVEYDLLTNINRKCKLYLIGNGIAFTIPLSSISGIIDKTITTTLNKNKGNDKTMENQGKYDLILVACKPQYMEDVIEASRLAGATGGTIINSRSIGNENVENFLGIQIQDEQDLIAIIALREMKHDIMNCIKEKAGLSKDAKGVMFSLPVDNLIGLGRFEDIKEDKK